MSKNVSFLKSFFIALILSVVSFFVIFFIFPSVSDKYFGVSIKSSKEVATFTDELSDKTSDSLDKVSDTINNTILDKVSDSIVERFIRK